MIIFFLIQVALSCESLRQHLVLYPTVKERFRLDLADLFQGSAMDYYFNVQQPEEFAILDSFWAQPSKEHAQGVESVISLAALKLPANLAWLNRFAFIEQDITSVDIFYTSKASTSSPTFDQVIQISNTNPQLRCFGIEFLDPETFLVDCGIINGVDHIVNKFLLATTSGKRSEVINDNLKSITLVKKRKILIGYKKKQQLLFRGTFETDGTSYLESFTVSQDKTNLHNNLYVFDVSTIAKYLKNDFVKFNFVDYSITTNGDLYVLDELLGIFVVQLSNEFAFNIIANIKPLYDRFFAFHTGLLLEQNSQYQRFNLILTADRILIYKDSNYYRAINLPVIISGQANVYLTGGYVLLHYKSIFYQYDLKNSVYLKKTIAEGQDQFLTNPYLPDLVAVSNIQAHRYYLSNGYLEIQPSLRISPQLLNIELTAFESSLQMQCTITIEYQRVAESDRKIYKSSKSFPRVVSSPSEPFVLSDLFSGAAIIYTQNPTSQSEARISDFWEVKLDVTFGNSIYGSTLAYDNYIYLLTQSSDLQVLVYKCNELDLESLACTHYSSFQPFARLTNSSFSWWGSDGQITISFMPKENTLTIAMISQSNFELIHTINSTEKIDSYLVMNNFVYLVAKSSKRIICYSSFFPVEEKQVIDQDVITSAGFTLTWAPTNIFGNRYVNSNLVFIGNGANLMILDSHKGFTKVHEIPFVFSYFDCHVAVNAKSFIVVTTGYEYDSVREYSIANLNDIYFMKELPLYGLYKLNEPLQADNDLQNGFLFLKSYSYISQQTEILIYQPNQLAQSCLRKIISTHLYINKDHSLIFSVSGEDEVYAYVNIDGKSSVKKLLVEPVMIINSKVDEADQYTQNSNIKLMVNNYWNESAFAIENDLIILNTFTKISMDEEALRRQNSLYLQSEGKTYILQKQWYQGQSAGFEMKCQDQPDNFQFQNKVALSSVQDYGVKGYELKSSIRFDGARNLLQGQRQLFFIDKQNNLSYFVNLELPEGYECTQSAVSDSKNIIFSLCNSGTEKQIHITVCTEYECFPLGLKINFTLMVQIKNAKKIGVRGGQFFVLNCDESKPGKWPGDLRMYKINYTTFELYDEVIFNSKYFKQSELYYADFQIVEIDTQTYIFLLDLYRGISTVESKLDRDGLLVLTNRYCIPIIDALLSSHYYLKSDTEFITFAYLKHYRDQILNVGFLVLTNNVAQYGIRLVFDDKITVSVDYMINQYGSWQASPLVHLSGFYAVLEFSSKFSRFAAVYKLPQGKENKMILLHGGVKTRLPQNGEPGFYYLSSSEDSSAAHLYMQESSKRMIRYDIMECDRIMVKANSKRQLCTIAGWNDFEKAELKIIVDQYYEDDNSLVWLIVLVSVCALVVAAVFGFYIYKRKQPKRLYDIQLLAEKSE